MATMQEVHYAIEIISEYAIDNYENSRVIPSLVIGQMCLESGYLTSELAKNANNPFGIKYNKNITNEYYEYKGSKWCKFKSYKDAVESQGKFYNLYERYSGIVGETNLDKVLIALEKSGYCEGSGYSNKIREMINRYDLTKYDEFILNREVKNDGRIKVSNDAYNNAIKVFEEKGIISIGSWKNGVNVKNTTPLIEKTCKYLYGISDYQKGIDRLIKDKHLSSDMWKNPKSIKASHLESFIIKISKIL